MNQDSVAYDLGTGFTAFRAGTMAFAVDLIAWVQWYDEQSRAGLSGYQLIEAARSKLQAENDVSLNKQHADAFLHALSAEYLRIKKKQGDELTSLSSTESTPSS